MLVLDEAHHAAAATSSSYAIDSQFTRGMRELTPLFEHRLFLSATPHNGHSNSFSALLAMLDPQRFIRGEQIKDPRLLDQVMVRRLEDELREAVPGLKLPKRDVVQHDISGLPDDAPDLALMRLLTQYRALREKRLEGSRRSQQTAANLVITTLQKRLFSSIEAFNSTLGVHRKSMEKLAAATESEPEVSADLLSVGIFARWRDRIPAAGLLRRGRKGASPGDRIPALRAMLPGVLHPATTQWRITFRFSSAIAPRGQSLQIQRPEETQKVEVVLPSA
jgi:hypothetical protein